MQITLELQNPNKLDFLLDLLRDLEYIRILPFKASEPRTVAAPENPPVETPQKQDFIEFWGCLNQQMSMESIDRQLAEMWEN